MSSKATQRLHAAGRPSFDDARKWIGFRVSDSFGSGLGRLEDVWVDAESGEPAWLLVRVGRFGGGRHKLVPFDGATAGGGHVWIPFERASVRSSPEIGEREILTASLGRRLRAHYLPG